MSKQSHNVGIQSLPGSWPAVADLAGAKVISTESGSSTLQETNQKS
jgi:hypothetical protein